MLRLSQEHGTIFPKSLSTRYLKFLVPEAGVSQTPGRIQKRRSTLRLLNLHHRSIGVQTWGICILDPPKSLGHGVCDQKPEIVGTWTFWRWLLSMTKAVSAVA